MQIEQQALADNAQVPPTKTKVLSLTVEPIAIKWDSGLPVFASERFLKAVSDECGWLGGRDQSGKLRCILPFTIIRQGMLRMVRFRVETVALGDPLESNEERVFLNGVVSYFRSVGADIIIPAATSAVFRTYPDGAIVAPYGSYVIDLRKPEDNLWRAIDRITRQNINTARRKGVTIREGADNLHEVYKSIAETFRRTNLPFMKYEPFRRFVRGLGENGTIMVADYQSVAQSYVVFGFSECCAYAIYAGNLANQEPGANKLLYWEAMRKFRNLSIKRFDFMGARINPDKGSKQEGINLLKKRFGAELIQGYIWKYSLRPIRSAVYTLGVRLLRGGDIVDSEHHKLVSGAV